MDANGVRLTDVRKSFGALDIIKGVDMEIGRGEFAVFVGPSGCGKSTLLRMVAGLEETTAGKIEIGQRDVTDVEPAKRGVAMVFQSYALYPHLTVYENMAFSLRLAKRPKVEVDEKVKAAAAILRLTDQLEKKPSQLSGGQRQRVAIGRAIVRAPEVFLFDEPLSNLDAELRVQMRLELSRLHEKLGATMIYVTHDQVEAMTLADKIFVLRGGVVQQAGRPLDLYDDPDNRFVAGFIGSPAMNFFEGTVAEVRPGGGRVVLAGGRDGVFDVDLKEPLPVGSSVTVGVRPEHLAVAQEGAGGIEVTIDVAEELGGVSYLYGATPSGASIVFEQRGSRADRRGVRLKLDAPSQRILIFDKNGVRHR
ncbi:sn-glycerol-3-phosphate ABC transporter ATP-binding protein UgpC [Ensifer sp. ENS07]|uniref:ABC transporter ATP-binding protein n=1 Tax=Ensifer sp. ENS07 TaxID=2769274 RepID=UPI0017857DCD|nr:sn-glycerol-3-phosphate ABC transporter ATP-binding protein UgpC [Ensifer sp. ENS07]MBD9641363.1 sn-glycerol-3-phosphate ABC transporter ATP-binding protein UgpC [Ensifer sp. ENS07]